MTLEMAVRNLESKFEKIEDNAKVDEDPALPRICSGGTIIKDELFPALYISPEYAVAAWAEEASSQKGYCNAKLEWVYKPELLEFQMTMADRLGQHRVVSPRFTVKSQFRVS